MNRIDDVIIFQALGADELNKIVKIQIQKLAQRLSERHIELDVTPAARDLIAREGFDPAFGARPMKRTIGQVSRKPSISTKSSVS